MRLDDLLLLQFTFFLDDDIMFSFTIFSCSPFFKFYAQAVSLFVIHLYSSHFLIFADSVENGQVNATLDAHSIRLVRILWFISKKIKNNHQSMFIITNKLKRFCLVLTASEK